MGAASKSGIRCSPDSSTTNESSPLRTPVSLALASRNPTLSLVSNLSRSLLAPCRRRHAANSSTTINSMITAAGTHQLAAIQSIQDPDSAGATAGFLVTTGAGAGTGVGGEAFSAAGGGVGGNAGGAAAG